MKIRRYVVGLYNDTYLDECRDYIEPFKTFEDAEECATSRADSVDKVATIYQLVPVARVEMEPVTHKTIYLEREDD